MSLIENRAAIGPLHRHVSLRADGQTLPSVADMVATLRPSEPLHCIRPAVISGAAQAFAAAFNGDVLYAVKCNPEPAVLRALWEGGIRHFDCASISEVTLVRRLFPGAAIHFMHPVKSRPAIREAWVLHGVRDFVLDSFGELEKINQEINATETLRPGLFIRIALPETGAVINLSKKFGADFETAVALLRAARPHCRPPRRRLPCRLAMHGPAGLA